MKRLSLLTTLAAAALLSVSTAGLAAKAPGAKAGRILVTKSCGAVNKTEIAQNNPNQSTSGLIFADVNGSTVNFTVGGIAPSCVIATFSAAADVNSSGINIMGIRALLDATPTGEIFLSDADNNSSFPVGHTYTFSFPSVSPGAHTLKMQFRALLNAGQARISVFDMNVRHR